MAHAGHALVGDPTYGGRRKLARGAVPPAAEEAVRDFPRQALHAQLLGFTHPVSGEMLRFESELPQDMVDLIAALRG
jgi:23S rRNA pseudouridine1911/1915/1917 synthase